MAKGPKILWDYGFAYEEYSGTDQGIGDCEAWFSITPNLINGCANGVNNRGGVRYKSACEYLIENNLTEAYRGVTGFDCNAERTAQKATANEMKLMKISAIIVIIVIALFLINYL